MAKSLRSSGIKKNKQALKRRVFGPVEIARNDRLSAKLLQLAQQPKPPRDSNMDEGEPDHTRAEKRDNPTAVRRDSEAGMVLDDEHDSEGKTAHPRPKVPRSKRELQRRQVARAVRHEKKRKPQNVAVFRSSSRGSRRGKR